MDVIVMVIVIVEVPDIVMLIDAVGSCRWESERVGGVAKTSPTYYSNRLLQQRRIRAWNGLRSGGMSVDQKGYSSKAVDVERDQLAH